MKGQEIGKSYRLIPPEHDLGFDVGRVDLTDEFAAPATRRQHRNLFRLGVPPHCHDAVDLVLTSCDHRTDGGGFGTKTRAGTSVYADPMELISFARHQRGGHVTKQAITLAMWIQFGDR